MPLVKLDDVLKKAQAGGYAVGAYNFMNMEMIYGIIDAAEETQTPVIIQCPGSGQGDRHRQDRQYPDKGR